MFITDEHIQYLEWVDQGRIWVKEGKYGSDWGNGRVEIDQLVAIRMERLGHTHLVVRGTGIFVALTARGIAILLDEREAWG